MWLETAQAIYRYMNDNAVAEPTFNLAVLALLREEPTVARDLLLRARQLFEHRGFGLLVDFSDLALLVEDADVLDAGALRARSRPLLGREDFAAIGHTYALLVQLLVTRRVAAGHPIGDVSEWVEEAAALDGHTA